MTQAGYHNQPRPNHQSSPQVGFTKRDAAQAREYYQHIAQIVNLIVNRIIQTMDEESAKAFTPSVFQTIHALHGMLNGREVSEAKPLFRKHVFTAPQFGFRNRSGEEIAAVRADVSFSPDEKEKRIADIGKRVSESAAKLVCRRLNDLAEAEAACGHRLLLIRRADGMTQEMTSYEGHPLLDAAEALYLAARNSPNYAANRSAAITEELLDEAVATLPPIPFASEVSHATERAPMDAGDMMSDAVLKGMWTKIVTAAERTLTKEFDCGADPELVAKKYAAKIERIGKDIKQRLARERLRGVFDGDDDTDDDTPPGTNEHEESGGDGKNNAGHVRAGGDGEEEGRGDKNVPPTPRQTIDPQEFSETPEDESAESMLDWALYWAGTGIPVFPVHEVYDAICTCRAGSECRSAGKHPRTPNGVDDATTDPEQNKTWWRKYPTANIGGAMGGDLRVLAVDVDPRNGGDASLHDLTEAHGEGWLDTKRHITGSGGFHLFYTVPEGVTFCKGKLAPGIDLKYTGGYVVLPPSGHLSGRNYELDGLRKPAPAPDWLIEELTRAPDVQPSKVINFQERRQTSIGGGTARFFGEGERNDGLRDVMCGRWIRGYAEDATDLYRQMLEVRDTRCAPGKDPAATDAQLWDMVQRTTRKFARGESVSA
jgi:putative DNA primase/helicase